MSTLSLVYIIQIPLICELSQCLLSLLTLKQVAEIISVCVHVCVYTSKLVTVKQTIWEAVKLNTFFHEGS